MSASRYSEAFEVLGPGRLELSYTAGSAKDNLLCFSLHRDR